MAEGCTKRVRGVPDPGAARHENRAHDCGARRQGRYRKALQGVEGGVFEIALKHRGNAYRVVYAVQLGPDVVVIDAFQKKSKRGIRTPQMDVDRVRQRVKRLKEALR